MSGTVVTERHFMSGTVVTERPVLSLLRSGSPRTQPEQPEEDEMRDDDAEEIETRVDKVRLSDRLKRIELIGRHVDVRAFVERAEVTGKDGGPIKLDISNMTDEQLDAELRGYGIDPDTIDR